MNLNQLRPPRWGSAGSQLRSLVIATGTLVLAFLLGWRASTSLARLSMLAVLPVVLLFRPALGPPVIMVTALFVPFSIGTGTEVGVHLVELIVPLVAVTWVANMAITGRFRFASSPVNLPLALFLISGFFSLVIGYASWDPRVPRPDGFTMAQLAQWGIFVMAALAFWLGANLIPNRKWLGVVTWLYIGLATVAAILRSAPALGAQANLVLTFASLRAPFWLLLASLAGGQLLFNRELRLPGRLLALVALLLVVRFAFFDQRDLVSYLVGVGASLATLVWLRFRRLRFLVLPVVLVALATGSLQTRLYEFAGGDVEWRVSGASRVALSERVIEVTARNPITGLGPAAYRQYARMRPLQYLRQNYLDPSVSSHNNYVDLYSHTGIVGLALLAWFGYRYVRVALLVRQRRIGGVEAGYANGSLAAFVGAAAVMVMADWMLPFVYNIGFLGFQAAIPVWLVLGGLVAIEDFPDAKYET